MNGEPVKVLYIVGAGRSGTTVFGRMLGQSPGLIHVGELKTIWTVGFVRNRPCGCGIPFRECPFWQAVVKEVFGGPQKVDPQKLAALSERVGRMRARINSVLPGNSSNFQKGQARYARILGDTYRAISEVSGARVIVDSSKSPSASLILNSVPGIQPYVVHLVRDSRAVVYSWHKEKRGPAINGWQPFILTKNPARVALRWNIENIFAQSLKFFHQRYQLVRYEDFASDPGATLLRVSEFLDEGCPDLDFINGSDARLEGDHTVGGNPMRFQHGTIEIRPDLAWQQALSKHLKLLVTGLTWPLLTRYGYAYRHSPQAVLDR